MKVTESSSPFGSRSRTLALLALQLLAESYARELARLLELSLSSVQKALQSLERDGLVVGRPVGRTRLYRLNPRAFARRDLERYLVRLSGAESWLRLRTMRLRRRPRRTGKPV
ncbi:MAG: winged helix-turn-helix domain-containing protein [Candidatus Eiseniibacteriota bacterium]